MSVVLQIHTVWPAEIRSSSSGHSTIVPEKELLHASKKNSNMRVYAIFYAWKKEHYKLWRKLLEVICKGIREKFKGDQKKLNKKNNFLVFPLIECTQIVVHVACKPFPHFNSLYCMSLHTICVYVSSLSTNKNRGKYKQNTNWKHWKHRSNEKKILVMLI